MSRLLAYRVNKHGLSKYVSIASCLRGIGMAKYMAQAQARLGRWHAYSAEASHRMAIIAIGKRNYIAARVRIWALQYHQSSGHLKKREIAYAAGRARKSRSYALAHRWHHLARRTRRQIYHRENNLSGGEIM